MSEAQIIKPSTLTELARDAVLKTATLQEASAELLRQSQHNKAFLQQLLRAGALQMVQQARSSIRASLQHEHLGGVERGLANHTAAMEGRATLFDWKLPQSGRPIGDATVADLSDAVDWHAGRAEFETARTEMYRKVQERLARSNKTTVRDAMDEDELATLMKSALDNK